MKLQHVEKRTGAKGVTGRGGTGHTGDVDKQTKTPALEETKKKHAAAPEAIDGASSKALRKNISSASTAATAGGSSAVGSPAHTRFRGEGLLGPKVRALAEGHAAPKTLHALGALLTALPGALEATLEGKVQYFAAHDLPKSMIGDPEEARMREWRGERNQRPMLASQVISSRSFLRGVVGALESGEPLSHKALAALCKKVGEENAAAVGPPYDDAAYRKAFVLDKKTEPHLWALEKALTHAVIAAETNYVPLGDLAKVLEHGKSGAAFASLCETAMAEAFAKKETPRETYFAIRDELVPQRRRG